MVEVSDPQPKRNRFANVSNAKNGEKDLYETHPNVVNVMIESLKEFLKIMKIKDYKKLTVFEPCAGHGKISEPLTKMGFNVITRDKFTLPESYDFLVDKDPDNFNLVITNPPFSIKKEILEKVLRYPKNVQVILLLPLAFMSTKTVRENLCNRDVHIDLLSPDPKFLHDGEAVDIGACVWCYINFPKVKTNISLDIRQVITSSLPFSSSDDGESSENPSIAEEMEDGKELAEKCFDEEAKVVEEIEIGDDVMNED